uniref:serine hydrolase domain-containing protein n=1 Tax=Novosphingobium sp. ZN18A2 TaxID=3079861 RepID=UPI00403F80FD
MGEMISAAQAGFDEGRLARIGAFVDEAYVSPGKLPCAQLLLARGGKPFHRFSIGQARADGTPVRDDTIFRIASMTKPITSIAFMMLVEEGKVALDDPVTRVIPEFARLGVYTGGGGEVDFMPAGPAAQMRMVDLLAHMSGLTYGIQNRTNVDAAYRKGALDGHRKLPGNDHFLEELSKIPLEFSPASSWNYSVSTDVIGTIVARLSGMSLGEFFRTRIFEPLGMIDTGFHCPPEKADRLCDAWQYVPGKPPKLIEKASGSNLTRPAQFESGGGGLLSTLDDYHRFCAMLIGRGAANGARIVSPKTLDLMTRNHLPGGADLTEMSKSLFSEAYNAGTGFGLGFGITLDPARTLVPGTPGEFFWGGIYSTAFFVDPVEKLHMGFMTQLLPSSSYPIRRQLKTLIYGAMTDSYA